MKHCFWLHWHWDYQKHHIVPAFPTFLTLLLAIWSPQFGLHWFRADPNVWVEFTSPSTKSDIPKKVSPSSFPKTSISSMLLLQAVNWVSEKSVDFSTPINAKHLSWNVFLNFISPNQYSNTCSIQMLLLFFNSAAAGKSYLGFRYLENQ